VNLGLTLLAFALFLALSAVFSGSETGFYSLSRVRLAADERAGRRAARLVQRLISDDRGLLITLLVGNTLALELMTNLGDDALASIGAVPPQWREVLLTLILTPTIFFAGELIPKDLFRHRPHTLLGICAPVIALARLLFWPLSLVLRLLGQSLERVFGLREEAIQRAFGRESVLALLAEGAASGALAPHAQTLARNVLELRSIPVSRVLVPWTEVQSVRADLPPRRAAEVVRRSAHSRLPVLDPRGAVTGYVHQLDLLAAGPEVQLESLVRPLSVLAPDLSVDRALARMRLAGMRIALVGSPDAPLGLVSLKDLLETISADLADW
jgi:putative hemolysin